jgi:hypothetical protein
MDVLLIELYDYMNNLSDMNISDDHIFKKLCVYLENKNYDSEEIKNILQILYITYDIDYDITNASIPNKYDNEYRIYYNDDLFFSNVLNGDNNEEPDNGCGCLICVLRRENNNNNNNNNINYDNLEDIKVSTDDDYINNLKVETNDESINEKCCICLEYIDKEYIRLYDLCKCNNYYHEDCIKTYLTHSNKCPTCKNAIEQKKFNL